MSEPPERLSEPSRGFDLAGPWRAAGHPGALNLRRLLAGEAFGSATERADIAEHVRICEACTQQVNALRNEQSAFEARIPFDRLSSRVERAARASRPAVAPVGRAGFGKGAASTRSFLTVMSIGAAASIAALVVGSRPLFEAARVRTANQAISAANRTKGGHTAQVHVRIAPPLPNENPQRIADADEVESLAPGERIRVGIEPGQRQFYFVVSVDDRGRVTSLYPEFGVSLGLPASDNLQYLPDAIELTGHGRESLIVLMTDQPLEVDDIRNAVKVALTTAGGDLSRMPPLAIAGDQFHRLFAKP